MNASLIESAKIVIEVIVAATAYMVVGKVVRHAVDAYNNKLTEVYEKHNGLMFRACVGVGVSGLLFFSLFIAGVFGVFARYILLFALLTSISFLLYVVLRRPDEQPNK